MKNILIIGGLLLSLGQLSAQSISPTDTKNYIYTKNCLDADCVKKAETVQYFDGLGRPNQIVAIKASPAQKDVVSHIEYDQYGRQSKSFLPVPQTGTQNGAFYENALANATNPDIYGTEKIYAEQVVENAPLTRVKKSYNVGNAWADKPVTYNYNTNTSATEVKKFAISTTWTESRTDSQLSFSGTYYPANSLMKTAVTDEDNNTTTEYRNGKGQTVLIRKNDGTQNVDTYYVYNEYNQLAFVIPPLAAAKTTIDETTRNSLCYQYRYDEFGRLVEKRIPGKGWEYLVYDKQDRVVLTQDAMLGTTTNTFTKKGWLFTKYDKFGRVVYTGFFVSSLTRAAMQTAVNNLTANPANNEERSTTPFTLNGMDVYYTKNAFPTVSMTILSVNYYDTYPPLPADISIPNQVLGQTVLSQDAQNAAVSTKTLPTASYVKNIENDNWTKDFIWYDEKGRVIGSNSINHLGGFTKTETLLDFAGAIKKTDTYHLRKQGESGVTVKERFVYDSQNRLLKHFHQVDSMPEELLTENTYNELSELKNKKVGNNLQSIDYAYNIRGWLTEVNRDQMGAADLGGKLFAYKVKYTQREGINNPDPVLFPNKNVAARYNGNITEVDWRSVETIGINPSLTPKRYGYAYDQLNRLSAGYYQNPGNPYSKENTEAMNYDLNGNISNLYRTSVMEYGNTTAKVIDNLTYIYSGNQATNITDATQNYTGYEGGGNTIVYDGNGNMTKMQDKGISSIKYNFLNLQNSIELSRVGNEYLSVKTMYGADGTKLKKESTTTMVGIAGSTVSKQTTDYLDGFQYLTVENSGGGSETLMLASESRRAMEPEAFSPDFSEPVGTLALKTADLQFLPTGEGFYDYVNDQYIYQYKDHLGNVRISFARNSAGALEITDANDYYPFGMNHLKTGNTYFAQGSYKSYKFGEKELQEFGAYDFGARIYMADIARWSATDPMAEANPGLSVYRYGFNNPIMFTDPNGMLEDAAIQNMWKIGGEWKNNGNGGFDYGKHTVGFDGSYSFSPDNVDINLPELVLNGYGSAKYWGGAISTYNINHGILYNGIDAMRAAWNKAVFDANQPFKPVLHNGSAYMMSGDVLGISDLVGLGLSRVAEDHPYAAIALSLAAIVATKGRATDDVLKTESNIWRIGAYKEMRGLEAGLDAHHVGQSAIMKKLVAGYDHNKAPTILVPEVGHRFLGPNGIVSRSTKGFTSAREVLARDIFELRRVYGSQGIPNSALQELIQANKTMYPAAFIK